MNTTNTNELVRMSGQFWKMSLDGNENIVLISTILGMRAKLSFAAFVSAVVRGTIQVGA